jgi:hypothetical protein
VDGYNPVTAAKQIFSGKNVDRRCPSGMKDCALSMAETVPYFALHHRLIIASLRPYADQWINQVSFLCYYMRVFLR